VWFGFKEDQDRFLDRVWQLTCKLKKQNLA